MNYKQRCWESDPGTLPFKGVRRRQSDTSDYLAASGAVMALPFEPAAPIMCLFKILVN